MSLTPHATTTPRWRKHFVPLESNPTVFTQLIHKLGLSPTLSFQDVLSLSDPDLLAFLPRPAYALILVFPTSAAYEKRHAEAVETFGKYDGSGEEEEVVWFKQTIYNACGLYAILHGICNGEARDFIEEGSLMARLLQTCVPLKPEERGLALEGSAELETAYAAVARQGDTMAPENPEDEVDFHYICFVKSHRSGNLFLLDGDQGRPLDLGPLPADQDVLSQTCLGIIRNMVDEDEDGSVNFSLMALVESHN